MVLGVSVAVEASPLKQELRMLQGGGVGRARRAWMRQLSEKVLHQILERQPVDTGRTAQAWMEAQAEVESDGMGRAGEGSAEVRDGNEQTEVVIENRVPYVVFEEYGTVKMEPFAMVRQALGAVQRELREVPFQI